MNELTNKMMITKGFTLIELLITILIVGILATIAIPTYQHYTRRAYYSEIVHATAPYKLAVAECYQMTGLFNDCNGGQHNIPANITTRSGGIAGLRVENGVITVVPVAQHGITAEHTYILTPTVDVSRLLWKSSGGGVRDGLAK